MTGKELIKEQTDIISQNKTLYRAFFKLQEKSPLTIAHCVNTSYISYCIGVEMGLKSTQLRELVYAALVHDIGKVCIDEHILTAKRTLTDEEFFIMKNHVHQASKILKGVPRRIKRAVAEHHENVNGSGYPRGKTGTQISLYGKILRVADVIDAICSRREYKDVMNHDEATTYLQKNQGQLFDEQVVSTYLTFATKNGLIEGGSDAI